MTAFRPREGLDEVVAKMLARRVQRITDQVADVARDRAPATKRWLSREDDRVRPEHRDAHGQEVPENLRFVLDSPEYDQAHYGAGPRQQLRRPRDPEGTPGLTENCRCKTVADPDGVARGIAAHPVRVEGTRVEGHVTCTGHRVVDAEFGTDKDEAARFMGGAVGEVARDLRASGR